MKLILFLLSVTIASGVSISPRAAPKCDDDACSASSNCRCSSVDSPLTDGEAPQLIALTFDESVVDNLFTDVWQPLLFDRTNPDNRPISGTFFVPHEYTDYRRVQDLWLQGFEIGVNSVTKNSLSQYWSNATQETLVQEFQGQRIIVSNFANIPEADIIGARTPQLQLEGDVSIDAYIASGIEYDNSWTSRSTSLYFPYTLDYLSAQECRTGTTCPTESHSGFWIVPIINLQGNSTVDGSVLECNSLITCNIQGTADEISEWLLEQVNRERSTTKAPLTIMLPSSWFRFTENSFEGFEKFLDTLGTYDDVFLVSQKQVVEWARNPVALSQFQTEDVSEREGDCLNINCPLTNANGDIRYMVSCVPCPETYPWLGNPLGQLNPTEPPDTTPRGTTPAETTPAESEPTTTTPPPEQF